MTTQSNKANHIASFIEEVSGESHLRIETDLGDGFVRLKSSEAERRQAAQDIRCSEDIVIEMLRNSRDAGAKNVFVCVQRDEANRLITILDDGSGIPESLHETIFEPRVTSKLDTAHMDKWGMHGRGMALFSIAVHASDSRVVYSEPGLGSSIQIATDLNKLPEKTDQSTFPRFEPQNNGTYAMRGPKNILRIAAEFALEHRNSVSVWLGSPAEIIATMRQLASQQLKPSQRIFGLDNASLPCTLRFGTVFEAQELTSIAETLGLEVSSRTAHRILNGEISALPSLLERLQSESIALVKSTQRKDSPKFLTERPIELTSDEIAFLGKQMSEAFSELAKAHYLDRKVEPTVRVSKDQLTISIPLIKYEEPID